MYNVPPVSKATLDRHVTVRQKIEKANEAVYEAIRAIVDSGDPIAANLCGADEAALQALGNIPKAKMLPILQTGVPIWMCRLAAASSVQLLLDGKGWSENELFADLLKSFSEQVPLTTI